MENETKPEYVLVNDAAGLPPVDRSIKTIKVYGTELRVPYLPKKGCNKCYGRGFIGIIGGDTTRVLMCKKCYPHVKG